MTSENKEPRNSWKYLELLGRASPLIFLGVYPIKYWYSTKNVSREIIETEVAVILPKHILYDFNRKRDNNAPVGTDARTYPYRDMPSPMEI